ncbi:ABC transporter ATP-binding protein [Kiritimatiellota bacterium B12222]|nr:ABC transporter ATP-binding protein [Kiritimatiellota bacterium B12222]
MTLALELDSMTRRYTSGKPPAVDGISLSVHPGETIALVGESGSGKSTLLRLICGLEKADAGRLFLKGTCIADKHIWTAPEKRKIGLVFQDGALFPHLTVEENIAYGLQKSCRKQKCQRIETLLCLVGMDGFQKRFPHELSGGERQRLAVIRSLAPEPDVLLLDEPFSNLDPALRRQLRIDVMRILKEVNTTAIMVTHDSEDALHVGDRIAILRQGKLEQIDSPHQVYHHPVSGYSARIFGEANRVNDRWIRPEDMSLIPVYAPGAHPVIIEETHDAGRHCEIRVRPQEGHTNDTWVLYDAPQSHQKPGSPAWVQFKQERP